jgi:hypothetical protein
MVLIASVAICFGRTLDGYFLADDFDEIAYLAHMFDGHQELLWSNFTGNYMQVPGMNVWRPGLLITIVVDWLTYGAQAWGYYLTNLLYYIGCVLTLYALCKEFSKSWGRNNSLAFAFLSASLFAVNPLHCESVSWMVGRVDLASGFYYLISFFCYVRFLNLKTHTKPLLICSLIAFTIALSYRTGFG